MACDCCDENSIELPIGPTGDDGAAGNYVTVTTEAAGLNCANGGFKLEIKSGVDDSVIDTQYVCNGTNGTNGTNASAALTSNSSTTTTTTNFTSSNVPSSALITLALATAGTYYVTYDIICKPIGYNGVLSLDYAVISPSVGCVPDVQFAINGSVQSTYNASNPSQYIAGSNSHAQHSVAVNTTYKEGTTIYVASTERKQTVSKTFTVITTGAETLSLYAWQLDPSVTATYPCTLYTYQIDINAVKLA